MNVKKGVFTAWRKRRPGAVVPALLIVGIFPTKPLTQDNGTKTTMTTQSRFYCNTKALNSTERAEHKQLTDKLIAVRTKIVETDNGYEFQFAPSAVSLAELGKWVVAEGKCCPFFDFHIDLEHAGSLLCLRLTGEDGIKAFIRSEFHVATK